MLLLALAPNAKKTEKEREQRSWQIDRNNQENAFLQSPQHRAVSCPGIEPVANAPAERNA